MGTFSNQTKAFVPNTLTEDTVQLKDAIKPGPVSGEGHLVWASSAHGLVCLWLAPHKTTYLGVVGLVLAEAGNGDGHREAAAAAAAGGSSSRRSWMPASCGTVARRTRTTRTGTSRV